MTIPGEELRQRVEAMVGFAPDEWREVHGGYTPAKRYVVRNGSRSAFVKLATTPLTARMLTREIANYQNLSGPFMPRVLGWHEDAVAPMLAIEDLSTAYWPPPWTAETAALVIDQIHRMHGTSGNIERWGFLDGGREPGWASVARDPAPFLSLGLVTQEWLRVALPGLVDAETRCELGGEAVTHLDLRSDNICIHEGTVKFIDWAEGGIGSAEVDLGFMLPSLAYEGGPTPDVVMPGAPEVAALVSGYFASRAGLPIIPDAPLVRRVQREQLSTALPWVQRALGLPGF